MPAPELMIGTRGSALALWQANHVADLLRRAHPDLTVDLTIIKTTGDKITDVALSKLGGRGLFTKELESALLDGTIDLCVHSMKDLPTQLPQGTQLAAMLKRADVRDVLVTAHGTSLEDLPSGARVGTSALRRLAQLRALRTDLDYVDLRGNLDTRIKKAADGTVDAAILAAAGIRRMGWESAIAGYFSTAQLLPAVGQGAIGIECRSNDARTKSLVEPLNHDLTYTCVSAERYVMNALEGGCQTPLAAYARPASASSSTLALDVMVAALDGTRMIKAGGQASLQDATQLAQRLTDELLAGGARELMDDSRRNA